MRHTSLLSSLVVVAAVALSCAANAQQPRSQKNKPTWLWVKDSATQIGIAGAQVDIAPGDQCWGTIPTDTVKWTAHYTTDAAGRVLARGLPRGISCRVTVNGKVMYVQSFGYQIIPYIKALPSWIALRNDNVTTMYVSSKPGPERPYSGDWQTTDDATTFRSYILEPNTAELIPDVKVTALPSGISTTSDANGLFTLEIPARYRKGKFPPMATQTLVFSKPGYRTLEYRRLVLHPGVRPLGIFLPRGTGTLVRTNGSIDSPGNPFYDEFATFAGKAPEHPPAGGGEILSLEIEPPITYDGTWIQCDAGTSAVLKARNLTLATISWTPTGTQMAGHDVSQSMKKVNTSPDGDTWDAELANVMSTNFVVSGIDKNGKSVSTMDIGNVGCE